MSNRLLLLACLLCTIQSSALTIMLDPAGDAKHTGRKLVDGFERGITLQCAERVKLFLERQFSGIRVVLTRCPGETVEPLQNANFANRLDTDLYINIQFYQETAVKPHLYIYYLKNGDDFIPKQPTLALYPFDKAHLCTTKRTEAYASALKKLLAQDNYEVQEVFGIPYKPLIGISAPALSIEVGLKQKDDWVLFAQALAEAITELITTQKI